MYHLIREFGKEVVSLGDSEENASIVEIDEMHSYIGSKKTTAGYGLLLIDLENGLYPQGVPRQFCHWTKRQGNR